MKTEILPNPALRDLYREPERMDERMGLVRLDRNERLTPFPATVFAEMAKLFTADLVSTYPDPTPLYGRIARLTGLADEHFFFTNGSDAALRLIVQAFVQPGDTLILSDPSYAMLGVYAKITQAKVALVPYAQGITLDVQRIEALLAQGARLLALPNPDQPTGTILGEAQLRRIISVARERGTVVVLDEAYYPFYPHTAIGWVRDYDNLFVTRSFSKAWGLSGLRLGLMAGAPKLVEYASRLRGLHEVNAVAVALGCYLMDHPEIVQAYVEEVAAGRRVLESGARDLQLGFPACYTNFQLLQLPNGNDPKRVLEAMKANGFLIKGAFRSPAIKDYIRTTVGGPELMTKFLSALKLSLNH